ncbi:MAG TPA: DUF2283 domain-containing protein [Candidatus Paceibacterota bacterium]|nr:DUF2283 domain-containing protein [Candidatus Paceibacterota bacterium]
MPSTIKLKKGKVHKTAARGSLLIDTDKKGELIGVEILRYSKAVSGKSRRPAVALGGARKRSALPASR